MSCFDKLTFRFQSLDVAIEVDVSFTGMVHFRGVQRLLSCSYPYLEPETLLHSVNENPKWIKGEPVLASLPTMTWNVFSIAPLLRAPLNGPMWMLHNLTNAAVGWKAAHQQLLFYSKEIVSVWWTVSHVFHPLPLLTANEHLNPFSPLTKYSYLHPEAGTQKFPVALHAGESSISEWWINSLQQGWMWFLEFWKHRN